MALDTRLDLTGLSHLWEKIKALVPAKSKKTQGIFYGELDSTSTATVMTATVDGITELVDGVAVLLKNGVITSASGWTLDINQLGAKPVYSSMAQATRITTTYNINYTWLFVYDSDRVSGGCWIAYYGYYSDANTIGYIIRTNSTSLPLSSAVGRYRLMFTSADGTHYVPATANTSTSATANKPVTQTPIDPFGRIVYYGYTSIKNAGEMAGVSYLFDQNAVTLGYSFAKGSALNMTLWKPVYLKCQPQSDGSAIIDATTPWVQDLPTTEDGKIYIFLGIAYSATNIELMLHHPVYEYKNGAVRQWTNTSVREIPDASQEADGTALVAVDGEWTKQTGYGYTKMEPVPVWEGYTVDQQAYEMNSVRSDEDPNYYELVANEQYDIEAGTIRYMGLTAIADVVSYQGMQIPLVYIGNGQLIGVSGGDQTCPFAYGYINAQQIGFVGNMVISDGTIMADVDNYTWYKFLGDGPVLHKISSEYIDVEESLGYTPVSPTELQTAISGVHGDMAYITLWSSGSFYEKPSDIFNKFEGAFMYYSASGLPKTTLFLVDKSGTKPAGGEWQWTLTFVGATSRGEIIKYVATAEGDRDAELQFTGTHTIVSPITKSCMTVKPSNALTLAPTANPMAVTLDDTTSIGTAFTADGTGIVCNKEMDVLVSGNCTWRSGGASVVTEVSIRQMGSGVQVKTGFAGGVSGVQNQHTITLSPFILHVQQNDTIQMTIKIYFGTANGDYTLNVGENWLTVQEI